MSNSGNGYDTVSITSCIFTANQASGDVNGAGGAVSMDFSNADNQIAVYISDCTFLANIAYNIDSGGGGGISVQSNNLNGLTVFIINCNLTANVANDGGGVYMASFGSSGTQSIINCTFTANFALYGEGRPFYGGRGGGVAMFGTNSGFYALVPSISGCTFTANAASGANAQGGGVNLFLTGAYFDMINCTFTGNSAALGDGGAVYAIVTDGSLDFSLSSFSSNTAQQNGGAIFASGEGTMSMSLCDLSLNSASLGGAIQLSDNITVSLQQCSLIGNTATAGGGLFIEDSSVSLTDVYTFDNTASTYGGDLIAVLVTTLTIQSVDFTHASALVAGGSMAFFFSAACVSQSVVSSALAADGAAIFIDPSSTMQATACMFSNNTAIGNGGAVDVEGSLFANASTFIANRAINGASLYMHSVITTVTGSSMLSCVNCTFDRNQASAGGACIFWQGSGIEPSCENCTYANSNQAAYGPWKATPAIRLSAAVPDSVVIANSTVSLTATLQDYYNQSVVIRPIPVLSAATVGSEVTNVASMPNGSTVAVVAVSGLNTTVALTFQAWTLTSNTVTVQLGECANGYGYTSDRCVLCGSGTYTANTLVPCQACSPKLTCSGSSDVTVEANYWPNINASIGVAEGLLCPFDFCDTGNTTGNIFDLSTVCNPALNRNGLSTLCGDCVPGYSEWAHECVPCNGAHAGAIVVQLLQLAGIVLLQRILSQSSGGATGLVMLVFVYQFADLALYPKPLLQLLLNTFGLQLPATSLGCPFPTTGYGQLAVQLVTPLVCLALLAFLYAANVGLGKLLSRCSRQALVTRFFVATGKRDAYIRTLVVLCLNLYETVLEAAFNFLVCVEGIYNNVNVVYQYPSVNCNDSYYATVRIVLIVLVALFVLGPVLIFAWLTRQRQLNSNSLKHLQHRYGRLFAEYKPGFYFWECVSLLRRAILLAVFVPIAGQDLASAKAALLATVFVFCALQVALKPYQQGRDNKFEIMSLITLAALIGLFGNDNVKPQLQSYLGGTILSSGGLVLIAPSVLAAARNARDFVRRRRSKSVSSASATSNEDQDQLLTPLV
eukprot:TRINITY_DN5060_c0_g2_i1.p1 TRINITY_DN5060_c0_g2~~TRINITY_DN5060_c0_g2_i1.p1  ORF type:complete len:1066 (-),score=234.56 TRINITY_DN5060_c0_g2_i1:2103-5300(-)